MNILKKYYPVLSLLLCVVLYSCVNLEQKTVLNVDGSGTMLLKYWTHNSNITGEEIAGFGFTEFTVNSNYTSANSEISDEILIDKSDIDTTTTVTLNLKFNDINKLPEAKGFSKVKAEWKKDDESDEMLFTYTLLKDSLNAISPGMSDFKLIHEFEFPGEVIETNGIQSGSIVHWENTIADLTENVFLTARIRPVEQNSCGLFGVELPLFTLFSILLLYRKKS